MSFPAGKLTASLSAATDDDDDDEPDGLVTARVAPGAGYTVGTTSAADVTVADNDRAQSVYFDVVRSADSVTEGQDVVFYLERRSEHGADDWRTDERGALVVNLQVAEALGRHVAGTLPSSVTFPAAASSVALTIATQDDGNGEKGGEVRATILSGAHYRRGEKAWDTVNVLDNDTGFAAVGIAVNAADVNEGADLVYTLTRHGGDLGRELAVRLSIRRADRGARAAGRSPFPSGEVPEGPLMELTIPANDNSVSWTWSTENDLVNEGDAEVTVRVDETHEYRTGAIPAPLLPTWVPFHVTTIVRDDDVPTVRMVNLSGSEIVEGEEVNARFERDSSAYTSTSTGDTHNFLDAHFVTTMVRRYLPPLGDRGTTGRESERSIRAGQSEFTTLVAGTRADEVGPLGGWFEARLVVRCPVRGVAQTCTDSRYEIGEPNSLRVEIRNNFPGVYVEADAGAVAEGEAARFRVTRVGGSAVGWTKTLNLRVEVTQDGEFIAGTTPTEVVFEGREVDEEPRETSVVLEIPTVNDLLDEADGAVTVRLLPSDCPGCLDVAVEKDYRLVDDTALGGADYRSATVAILDDDLALRLAIEDAEAVENEGGIEFAVTLGTAAEDTVTTFWRTADGTATAGDDYTAETAGVLTFSVGDTRHTITVPIADDTLAEADETLFVELYGATNITVDRARAAGTITDDDLPSVTVATDPASVVSVVEGTDIGFVLTRDGDLASALQVGVRVSEEGAYLAADAKPAGVAFAPGAATARLTVATDDDTLDEEDGAVSVELPAGDRYRNGDPAAATATVTDDDEPPALAVADAAAPEGAGEIVFTALLDTASGKQVTVAWSTAEEAGARDGDGGAAWEGVDYQAASGTLTFAPGALERTVTVTLVDDEQDEPDERFAVALSEAVNATAGAAAHGTIEDDDLPVVTVAAVVERVEEGAAAGFTVTRAGDLAVLLAVPLTVSESGSYLSAEPAAEARFEAGQRWASLLLATVDDAVDEEDGTVTVTVDADADYVSGDPGSAQVVIGDDDAPPELSIADARAVENAAAGALQFTVALSAAGDGEVTVAYATADGTATAAEPADYVAAAGRLTFASGVLERTVTVALVDDVVDEDEETFTVALSGARQAILAGGGQTLSATGTIADDDAAPELSIAAARAAENVAAAALEFTVALSAASERAVTVAYATADGTATAAEPADYVAAAGTLTFAPGALERTVTVALVDDVVDEDEETFTVALSGARQAALAGGGESLSATGIIADDDAPPELAIAAVTDPARVAESGGSLAFRVTLSAASERVATVAYETADGAATADADYTATGGVLVFEAGTTGHGVTVAILDDTRDEADETFDVQLREAQNATIAGARATATIIDDDPTPTLAIAAAEAGEGAGSVAFRVTLSAASGLPVTVAYATADGTALAVADYTAASGSLTFGSEETQKIIRVLPADDELAEADETFTVTLSDAVNATAGPAQATGTITDDDRLLVSVAAAAPAVTAGADALFTVTATGATSSTDLEVDYAVAGTAAAGDDYTQPSGSLTIPAGAARGTITIATRADADAVADPDVTLIVSLVAAATTGTTVVSGSPAATTIEDDDHAPVITGTALTVAENQTAVATLAASDADGDELEWSIPSGTAGGADGAHFTLSAARVLAFKEAKDYENPDDADGDGAYELTVQVSDGHNPVTAALTVTLTDVVPAVTIATEAGQATEGDTVAYTVTRSGDLTGALSVTVTVSESGGAVLASGEAGARQVAFSGTAATAAVSVGTVDDAVDEPDATVTATLTAAAGYTVEADNAAAVTVADDDAAPEVAGEALAVGEGVTEVATLTATDADLGDGALQWEIPSGGGADAAHFTLTGAGVLAFKEAKDYENPDDADGDGAYELTVQVSDGHNPVTANLTVTLTDVVPEVTVAADAGQATEGDTVAYTLTRSGDLTGALSVTVTVSETGGAVLASGEAGARQVAFSGTAATAAVSVGTVDDAVDEPDATVTATLTAAAGYTVGSEDAAAVTVADDEELEVSVTGPQSVAEGAVAPFTVTVAGGTSTAPVAVSYTVGGTATAGTDYTAPSGTLTLAAGAAAGTITVATLEDGVLDPGETLEVTLSGASTAARTVAVSGSPATTTIVDEGTATVSVAPATATEGAELAFTVALTGAVAADVELGWATADATAAAGDDYTAVSEGTVTIAGGRTAATLTVATVEDTLAEAAETFTVTLAAPAAGLPTGVSLGTASADGTIADDDPLTASVSAAAATVMEGEAASFTVALSGGTSTAAVAVAYTVGGTATAGDDYASPAGTLTLAAGAADGTITIATKRDEEEDPSETLEVTLSGASTVAGTVQVDPTAARTTIADEGTELVLGEVRALLEPATVTEGEVAQFAVTLSGTVTAAQELSWTTMDDGTATAGDDYTAASGTLTFLPAGAVTQTIEVATTEDALAEETETFTVGLGTAKVTGAIEDDDHAPAITATALTVAENQTAVAALVASDADGDTLEWSLPSGDGGGADAAQFTLTAAGVLAFKEAKDYENPDDADGDGAYELTVQVSDGHNPVTANLTVTLTDVVPEVTIAADAEQATEGDTVAYTLTRSGDLTGALSVTVTVSESGGAVLASGEAGPRQVAFSGTAATAAVSVATVDDAVDEPDATVTAALTAAAGYTVGTDATAAVTVIDNDQAGIVLTPTALGVTEGESETYTVELATEPSGQVTVTVGGATGTDLTVVTPSLTFTASTWNTVQTVEVRADEDDDGTDDPATLTHTGAGGGYGSVTEDLPVTVTDNDSAGIVLTPTTLGVTEGSSATYTVELTTEPSGEVTVTVGGTTGTDLTVVNPSLTFTDSTWNTAQTVEVRAGQDDDASDESATLTHTASGADYGSVTEDLPVTVTDDETAGIALTTAPTSVREDDSATEVTVTATLGGSVTLSSATEVTVSVGGGSATSGTDYPAVENFTLTIAATESSGTGTFTLTPTQDSISEGDETIDVTGTAGGITVTKATMTLTDDETAPTAIALTTAPTSVGEDDSATEVTVTATLGGSVTLSSATEVTVSVGGGSATSGTDYPAVENFTLTIAATESTGTGTFMLTPTQDSVSEGNETIDVTGAASGFTVTKAEMTLTDDETAPGTIALTTAPTSVREDDSATEVAVTATLGGSVTLSSATEVTVSVGGGSATSGTDYPAVENFKLTIAATESSGTGTFTLTPTQDSVSEDDETIDVTGVASDFTVTKAEMTLTDDETAPTAIALTTAPTSVREDDSATEVTVTATLGGSVTLSSATEVTVSVGGGSATSGTDYTAVENFTLTIAATESSGTGTFTLTPTQDSISEDDETIDVTGVASDFTVTQAEMTLTDDETAPGTIALTTAPTSVREDDSATEVTVTATLGGSVTLSSVTEVTVSVGGGSATSGTDYPAVENFKLTIAATESSGTGTFTLTPTQDSVSEGNETIDVTGTAGGFTVTKAEMTLTDDETAPTAIALTTAPTSVREDDSATEVTVTATLGGSVTLSSATEVTVSVGGGSATSGTDYTAVADFTLTIAATESSGTGTFTLTPTQDSISEGNETIDVTGTAGGITVTKATMTLTDDETAPTAIALTTAPSSVREDASATEVTVTATLGGSVTLASATEVTVSVGGGSATSGTDYTAVENFTLTIAATESSGTGTFTLTPTQDSISEGNETIDVTGTAGGFTVTKAEMTLTDDETAPTAIALTTAPTSVREDDSATEVTVTATLGGSVTLAGATEVTVSVGGGTATSGTDYTAVADFTLTIAATESTGTGTFTLTPTQDSISEGDETIDVTGAASDFTVTKAEMTLTDDETAPGTIALTTAPTSVGEDDSATEVTVTATLGGSVTLSSATEVTVSVGGGSATSGTDYTAVENFTLTIAATESSGTGTFTLTPTQDSISEGDETIDVTGAAGGFTVTKAEMTLTDDETAPGTIALTTAPSSVAEDDSATEVTVTATLGGSVTLSSATEVTVSVGGGTATSGTDYTAVADFTLTIAATESTGTGTFMLTPTQDSISEGDETIDVTGAASGFTVTQAEMTLTDDETAPTAIALTTAPTSVREDDSATEVTVTATLGGSVTLSGATEVTVSVGGGSATSGTDYTAVENFTLTIAATESSGTGTFTLTPTQDSISEDDETIDVTGAAGGITVTKAEMTLTDDETAPGTIALTTAPTSVGEDASATEVTVTATLGGSVTLSSATEVTVSVGGGTATSGTDYTAVADFKLTIAATESTGTGTFMLTPTQDSVSEGNETIDVTGVASDFTVTKAEMTLTDDETAPGTIALTTAPTSVGEDASATEVTVTATLGGSVTLSSVTEVTVSVGGGSATSGTDYTAVADFTLTIAATESSGTGTFTLTPTQDSISEGNETIDVTGAAGGITVTKAEMTLTDDETAPGTIALTTAPSSVREDDSATEVTVTATLGGSVTLSSATEVTVSVGGGSATSGTDYTAVENFKLTIAATESTGTGTFTLTPTQDSVSEGNETIDVTGAASDFTVTKAEMTLTTTRQRRRRSR